MGGACLGVYWCGRDDSGVCGWLFPMGSWNMHHAHQGVWAGVVGTRDCCAGGVQFRICMCETPSSVP